MYSLGKLRVYEVKLMLFYESNMKQERIHQLLLQNAIFNSIDNGNMKFILQREISHKFNNILGCESIYTNKIEKQMKQYPQILLNKHFNELMNNFDLNQHKYIANQFNIDVNQTIDNKDIAMNETIDETIHYNNVNNNANNDIEYNNTYIQYIMNLINSKYMNISKPIFFNNEYRYNMAKNRAFDYNPILKDNHEKRRSILFGLFTGLSLGISSLLLQNFYYKQLIKREQKRIRRSHKMKK